MTYFENVDYEEMFGNDSGENEKDQALKEYFVDVPEFRNFLMIGSVILLYSYFLKVS